MRDKETDTLLYVSSGFLIDSEITNYFKKALINENKL